MKKFIKINLIILVIVSLSCLNPVLRVFATSERTFDFLTIPEDVLENIDENGNIIEDEEQPQEESEGEEEPEEEKTLDDLQIEKNELEMGIDTSNAQIQFI